MLVGLPAYLLRQLQSVLNAAARLVYHLKARDHITDALISLHWLRAPEPILYKMAVLTYKALHGGAPRYLTSLVHVANVPDRRALRSAGLNRLQIPLSNCQPSAVERFRSQQHSFGTGCLVSGHVGQFVFCFSAATETYRVLAVISRRLFNCDANSGPSSGIATWATLKITD